MDAKSPPRRDRRAANRQQRRDAILDVAFASFARHGYGGTTMSEVAARLGGSKATLWSYFPSKEALFAAVIDRATEDFRSQLTDILNPDDDVDVALRRFCERFLSKVTLPEWMAVRRMVIGETTRFPELGRILYDRAQHPTHRLLADYIAELERRGRLATPHPMTAAHHLLALCMATGYQLVLIGHLPRLSAAMLRDEVGAALETFLAAYANSPG
jgi:AcrR family transcriptional regulator